MIRSALGLAAILAAAALNLGCGRTACFQWSEVEGSCPDHNKARTFFGDCSDISSVDDDGKFANDLCCYSVTKSNAPNLDITCSTDVGTGGTSFSTTGIAAVTGGPIAATTTATGPNMFCDNMGVCGDIVSGCMACALNGPCSVELSACNQDQECTLYSSCIGACNGDATCITKCGKDHPTGVPPYDNLVSCTVCKNCPNSCSSMAAMACGSSSTSSSSGGGGGAGGMSGSSGMGGAGGK